MPVDFWIQGAEFGADPYAGDTFSADPWDLVIIGGNKLPGVATVKSAAVSVNLDKKKPKGSDHATITITGYEPGQFDVEVEIWTADQWVEWQKVFPEIWTKPNKRGALTSEDQRAAIAVAQKFQVSRAEATARITRTRTAQTIVHPALNSVGINDVIVVSITPPSAGSTPGAKTIKIRCQEYVAEGPPQPRGTTVKGSSSQKKTRDVNFADNPRNAAANNNIPLPSQSATGPTGEKPKSQSDKDAAS